ncbi:hypothetical protein HMPREF1986_00554 [Oribacterium sp. oral taxon 078 str. F0263]|nr:hypothetical protein HMPREF1986_00554 [Oribacterium sp. oral taxon 078 str. F0263]
MILVYLFRQLLQAIANKYQHLNLSFPEVFRGRKGLSLIK